MNFDQLRSFQQVALTGSFTKAARILFLTQPAVSQQIRALEDAYGIKLFDRSGQKVQLTREGDILYSRTHDLIGEVHNIKRLFEELSDYDIGKVGIASTAVFSTYCLPKAMGHFNSKYPGVELDLQTGNSHKVITKILEGTVDFGFGGVVKQEPDIKFVLIHQEEFVLVVGSTHHLANKDVVTVDDLRSTPFIWREHGTLIRRKMEEMVSGQSGFLTPVNIIEVQNLETGKRLVEEGYGVTIIPSIAVRREVKAGLLKEIHLENFDLKASYYLMYHVKRMLSKRAEAFLSLMSETVKLSRVENITAILKG